jgi:hypothetical protein
MIGPMIVTAIFATAILVLFAVGVAAACGGTR